MRKKQRVNHLELKCLLVVALAACGLAVARPARAAINVPAIATTDPSNEPGLKLTIQSQAGGAPDVLVTRLAALRVPEGSPASAFVPAGPFKAVWEGFLTQRIKGDFNFLAQGNGAIKVTIADQPALDISGDDLANKPGPVVHLKKGKNPIRIEYTSPKDGAAWVRVYWSAKEFMPEPVPPMILSHDASDQPLRLQQRLREGRELVANLRCLKCHGSDITSVGGQMRELSADTPSLLDVGQRLTQTWLAHWINNPHSIRPDTEMPRLFVSKDDNAVDQNARDIAAYLVDSSAKSEPKKDDDSPALITKGTRLYTSLGCIACHVLSDQANPTQTDTPRFSLKYVKYKFQPGMLKAFLLKPEEHYQWIRMPDFRLSDTEASALSAFLRSRSAPALQGDTTGDAQRGQKLFQSAGCISCHSSKQQNLSKPPDLATIEKSDFTKGCMAKDAAARGAAPDFGLSDDQRSAIVALAATQFASLKSDNNAELAERLVTQMNCLACHSRDREDDAWSQLSSEIDALTRNLPPQSEKSEDQFSGDQSRPPLTWVGEKLRPRWMATFIGGKLKYKPRPFLQARMPGFASRSMMLAIGLAQSHGFPPSLPGPGKPDPKLAEIGMKLAGKVGGLSCVQCHGVGAQKALAPFEAPAINFQYITERLNREYYDWWTMNPQRVLRGTRMPSFAASNGKTSLTTYFDGDARQQFNAIWNYMEAGDKIQPPAN